MAAAATVFLHTGAPAARAQSGDTLLLDLPGAVARALRSSDESRLAALNLDAASAQLTSARAATLPQITLNSSYSQVVRNARAEIVGSVFGQSYNYAANLNISQTLFQGGRAFYAWRSASHARDASALDGQEIRASLQVDVERAYLNALFTARLVTIQQNGLVLARDRLSQIEQLAQSGRAARYDVLRARVETVNFEPVVLQAVNNRTLAELELRRLLNIPVGQPMRLTTELDTGTARAVISMVGNSGAQPATDRPLLRSAELTFQARSDAKRAARAGFLPTVSVFLRTGFLALPTQASVPWGVGRTSASLCPEGSAATRVCQNNGWFRDESFGLNVSWPLFDGFRAKGDLALATAQARIAELQLRLREEQVSLEIARARAEFERARSAFEVQRANAGEAQEAYQLASLRFSRGLGTQLEVSDAQLALLTSQSNEALSVYDLHLAAAELARSMGRPIPLPAGGNGRPTSPNY